MKEIKDIESYKLGFMNGLDFKQGFKYEILGHGMSDVMTAIEFWQINKDKQMTVEFTELDAIVKMQIAENKEYGMYNSQKISQFLVYAKALGLIKFKEENKVSPEIKLEQIVISYLKDRNMSLDDLHDKIQAAGLRVIYK